MTKCHICGRSGIDPELIKTHVEPTFEQRLSHEHEKHEGRMQDFEQTLGRFAPLLESVDEKYRKLSIKTLQDGLIAFKELIPNIEEVLEHCKEHGRYATGETLDQLLNDSLGISRAATSPRDASLGPGETKKEAPSREHYLEQQYKNRIEELTKQRQEFDNIGLFVFNVSVDRVTFEVLLCPICDSLIRSVATETMRP
jgi:hypothetical protein